MFLIMTRRSCSFPSFFFNDTATTEIYTLSLHDALPICRSMTLFVFLSTMNDVISTNELVHCFHSIPNIGHIQLSHMQESDAYLNETIRNKQKSTRLNSSHLVISYAVFCLKKKKKKRTEKENSEKNGVLNQRRHKE